jgi:hypothetical protein
MAKNTKTFKIGEYAQGGIIKVIITGKIIQIKVIDMFDNEELKTGTTSSDDDNFERKLHDFLCDVTTSYYAGQIMKWIGEKMNIKFMWA